MENGTTYGWNTAADRFRWRVDRNQHIAREKELLSAIRPQYIILETLMYGGTSGGHRMDRRGRKTKDRLVITGLRVKYRIKCDCTMVRYFLITCYHKKTSGTGALFTDNVEMPFHSSDCSFGMIRKVTHFLLLSAGGREITFHNRSKQQLQLNDGMVCNAIFRDLDG